MRNLRFLALLGLLTVTLGLPTHGATWDWVVQKVTGNVVFATQGTRALALEPARILKRGDIVQTGANGRVRLVRTSESVFIGPNTIASIAKRPTPGMRTTVLLERGSSEFQIQKRSKAHFSVETPYLVAIVKGTTFKVNVGARTARVSVTEGRVQVKSLISGNYTDIVAGQTAIVNSSGELDVSGAGQQSPIYQGQPRAPMSLGLSLGGNGVGNLGIGSQLAIGQTGVGVNTNASVSGSGVAAGVNANANVGGTIGANVNANASVGGSGIGAGVNTNANVAGSGIGVGVNTNVGGGGLGLGVGVNVGGLGLGLGIGGRGR
ncbi:MAG TPA: FecR family protein [Aestuariivirgaceae bacterium]|nr:FecR family protein [Aestuariivirgaceae bacterium]